MSEEATRTAPCRPNPTDPGDAADLSTPQGYFVFAHPNAPGTLRAVLWLAAEGVCHSLLNSGNKNIATIAEINQQNDQNCWEFALTHRNI